MANRTHEEDLAEAMANYKHARLGRPVSIYERFGKDFMEPVDGCEFIGTCPTYVEAGTTQPVERKPCQQCQIDQNADAVRSMVRNMNTSVDVKV